MTQINSFHLSLAAALAMGIGLTLFSEKNWAQPTPSAASDRDIAKMAQEVSDTIQKALKESATLDEFRAHTGHPENVLHRLMDTQPSEAVCNLLEQIDTETLLHLEEPLSHESDIPCSAALTQKIQNHWTMTAKRHESQRKLRQRLARTSPGTKKELPKTEVVEIDTSKAEVFYRGNLKDGQIALTFDDGPHPSRTRVILDILKERNVQVTFFSKGQQAKSLPELVQAESREGHSVGSHSMNHKDLSRQKALTAQNEVIDGHAAVTAAMKPFESAAFFRFPYGAKTTSIQEFVKSKKLSTFFWNIDTLDWKLTNPAELVRYTKQQIDKNKGGILLMHDIQHQTTVALPEVLDYMAEKGITPVVFIQKR